ncbi:MAG: DUF2157 domain-containing protein [Actinomycetes bacterium]
MSLLLEPGVTEGLISAEQADRIRASEHLAGDVTGGHAVPTQRAASARRSEISLVTEALGYVGGLLVVLAAVLIGAQVWQQLPLAGRLALTGGTGALVLAGFAVPSRRAPQGNGCDPSCGSSPRSCCSSSCASP